MNLRGQNDGADKRLLALTVAIVALLLLAFLFGGASRQHALRLAAVELGALPLLVLSIRAMLVSEGGSNHRLALGLLAALITLPLVQIAPLPPFLWQALPGREEASLALSLAGIKPGWAPISLTPDFTWRAALALLPPVAVFSALLVMPHKAWSTIIWLCLALTVCSITLAAAQVASGSAQLNPYSWTDAGHAVGLFANRNHLAALCTSTLPFAAALATTATPNHTLDQRRMWFGLGYVGLAIVTVGAIVSRAGILLAVPALFASIFVAWFSLGRPRFDVRLVAVFVVAGIATAAVSTFALAPILTRFDALSLGGRGQNWPMIFDAAQRYLPTGSGIGSFDTVFRSIETLDQLDSTYFNEAHNEYLQVWLEAGWFGVAAMVTFLIWFGRRTISAWHAGISVERNLQRAASVSIALLLVHSTVDYPLRTETLAVYFAICCGILEFAGVRRAEKRTAPET